MHNLNNYSVQTIMQTKTLQKRTLTRKLNKQQSDYYDAAFKVRNVLETDTRGYDGYDTLVLATSNGTTTCYCIKDTSGMLTALMTMVHRTPNTHCIIHKFNTTHTQIGMLEAAKADAAFVNFTKPLALAIAKHTIALDKLATKRAKQAVYTANWKAKQALK